MIVSCRKPWVGILGLPFCNARFAGYLHWRNPTVKTGHYGVAAVRALHLNPADPLANC